MPADDPNSSGCANGAAMGACVSNPANPSKQPGGSTSGGSSSSSSSSRSGSETSSCGAATSNLMSPPTPAQQYELQQQQPPCKSRRLLLCRLGAALCPHPATHTGSARRDREGSSQGELGLCCAGTRGALPLACGGCQFCEPTQSALGVPSGSFSGDGEFPLCSHPAVTLRILSSYGMTPHDLAHLEAACMFFRQPAGFIPDPALPLPEMAAHDACLFLSSFKALTPATRDELRQRCGGSWKLLLGFLRARELGSSRHGCAQVAAGCAHSVVVSREGEVWTFGHGGVGQLGHGPHTESQWRPRTIRSLLGTRIVQAAAGRSRTMLVTEAGLVYHFGRDCFGDQEYSLASPKPIHTPQPVKALSGIHVVQVTMGSFFTAVLSAEGRVYTFSWGDGDRLGHATDLMDAEARLLAGGGLEDIPVVQIAGGHCYLLALAYRTNGRRSVWSVGCGLGGKLGHGTRSDERLPKEIHHFQEMKFEPVAVAAGAWHAVALSRDGRVATWGWGRHGCLGHGGDQCETVPRVLDHLAGQVACHVAAGDYTTFVVGAEGQVWSFGSSESSCLGHCADAAGAVGDEGEGDAPPEEQLYEGTRRQRPRDVMVPRRVLSLEGCVGRGDRVVQISTSNAGHWDAHMLALTELGSVLACGAGSKGQLGCQLEEGGYERSTPGVVDGLVL